MSTDGLTEGLNLASLRVFENMAVPPDSYVIVHPEGKMTLGKLVAEYDGMTLNDYQRQSMRTAVDPGTDFGREYQLSGFGLGLAGEAAEILELAMRLSIRAGETADRLKKVIHHEHGMTDEQRDEFKKELGDELWYLQGIASRIGLTLHEVAQGNIDKLKARYPEGWTREDSINREDA